LTPRVESEHYTFESTKADCRAKGAVPGHPD
jgi:hypothetical protein